MIPTDSAGKQTAKASSSSFCLSLREILCQFEAFLLFSPSSYAPVPFLLPVLSRFLSPIFIYSHISVLSSVFLLALDFLLFLFCQSCSALLFQFISVMLKTLCYSFFYYYYPPPSCNSQFIDMEETSPSVSVRSLCKMLTWDNVRAGNSDAAARICISFGIQ